MSLRRLVVLRGCRLHPDGARSLAFAAGKPIAGVTAVVIALAVIAHVYGADSPREIVAVRTILKAAVIIQRRRLRRRRARRIPASRAERLLLGAGRRRARPSRLFVSHCAFPCSRPTTGSVDAGA